MSGFLKLSASKRINNVGLDSDLILVGSGQNLKINYKNFLRQLPIDVNESAQRVAAVPPGVLPPGEEGKTQYMEVTAVGTWTYGGTTVGSNADGYRTTFWWDGSAWINNGSVRVKGDAGSSGATLSQLFNASKVGGYAVDEKVRDANYVEYVSLVNANTAPLSDATKWRIMSGGLLESSNTGDLKEVYFNVGTTPNFINNFSDGVDLWSVIHTRTQVIILQNGGSFLTFNKSAYPGLTSSSCFLSSIGVINGKIHILLTHGGSTVPFIRHFIVDVATKAITNKADIAETGRILISTSQIVHNGKLYANIDISGVTDGSTLGNAISSKLYELDANDNFVYKSTIIEPLEQWGDVWYNGDFNVPLITARGSRLFSIGGTLGVVSMSHQSFHQAVIKKSLDDGATWTIRQFLPADIYPATNTFPSAITFENKLYIGLNRFYKAKVLTQSILAVFNEQGDKYINLNYPEFSGVTSFIQHKGLLYIGVSTGNNTYLYSTDFKKASNIIEGGVQNVIEKDILPTKVVGENYIIGDYFETKNSGDYSNFKLRTYSLNGNNFTDVFAKNGTSENIRLVYLGKGYWRKDLISDTTRVPNRFFTRGAINNEFRTNAVRIPSIAEDLNGDLIALMDVRLISDSDSGMIDVGMVRSYNKGLTWHNYSRPIVRAQNDWRVHDPSVVVDRVNKRIWIFGKEWQSSTSPTDVSFWSSNPNLSKFYTKYSDDNGLTWSEKEDLTSLRPSDAWHLSSGANSGIQLKNGTLLIPMYSAVGSHGAYTASFIYKTLGSSTWQFGNPATGFSINENQICEAPNGDLFMIGRGSGSSRVILKMEGGIGGTWVQIGAGAIPSVTVNAALVCFQNTFFATQVTGQYGGRSGLNVLYSYDMINWNFLVEITNYATWGYASIIVTNNHFGILFEDENATIAYQNLEHLRFVIK